MLHIERAITQQSYWDDCSCNIHEHLINFQILLDEHTEVAMLGFLYPFVPIPLGVSEATFENIRNFIGKKIGKICFYF